MLIAGDRDPGYHPQCRGVLDEPPCEKLRLCTLFPRLYPSGKDNIHILKISGGNSVEGRFLVEIFYYGNLSRGKKWQPLKPLLFYGARIFTFPVNVKSMSVMLDGTNIISSVFQFRDEFSKRVVLPLSDFPTIEMIGAWVLLFSGERETYFFIIMVMKHCEGLQGLNL